MTSGSSLQLPERAYSSKPRPGTLGSEATSSRRPGLPGDAVHIHDARGRHATPPVENPVLVETYPHSRPDSRRPLLVTALQNLLRLRVPILYRDHSLSSQPRRREGTIPTHPVLFQLFACITDIGFTYICERVSPSARRLWRLVSESARAEMLKC